jgi:dTDP-4-amino-4,6-dideoxygalactose transaminase
MSDVFLPFSKPTISEEAIAEVVDSLRSGWITTGPKVEKLSGMLKDYLSAQETVLLASATAGMHLALLSLDLQPGDEIITASMTFISTPNMIVQAGGTPVFVDIDSAGTLNMNIDDIEKAITPKTRAIIPVHFAGLPVDLDRLYALAKKHNLRIIEDAAHAIGAEYKNKKIGSFGDTQIFSFHPNKNMTTGEGGCVTTSDSELAARIRLLGFHGMDRVAWNRYGKTGKQDYEIIAPGFKYNMMDIQAAIGIHQLPQLDTFNQKRQALAHRYLEKLAGWKQWHLPAIPDYDALHVWHIFTPLLNIEEAGMNRATFMEKMKALNIGSGVHYKAAHLYPYYQQHYPVTSGQLPNTEYASERIISLPLFPTMTFEDQDRVIDAMHTIFNSSTRNN